MTRGTGSSTEIAIKLRQVDVLVSHSDLPDLTAAPSHFAERFVRAAFKSARSRAAQSGKRFEIEWNDIWAMFKEQNGCCAISRLKFSDARFPDAFVKHPFAPSIDRIDSCEGYVPGNVRLVCTAVNFGLGQWGEEVFRSIAEATVRNQPSPAAMPSQSLTERIQAAQAALPLLNDAEKIHQKRRIAGLKRALTLGAEGLRRAAQRAQTTRLTNHETDGTI